MSLQRSLRRIVPAALASAFAMLISAQVFAADSSDNIVRWGSSVLGAGSQTTISAMASVVTRNTALNLVEQVTAGPVENMRLLQQGEIEIGQLPTGVAYDGFHGKRQFAPQGKTDIQGLFTLYPANMTFAVAADSGMRKAEDLKGKRLAIGPPGSNAPKNISAWLEAFGAIEGTRLLRIGYTGGCDGLSTGTVDACLIFVSGRTPSGYTRRLDLAMDIVPIEWDTEGESFQRLKEQRPELAVPGVIPAGILKHLDRDIQVPRTYSAEYATGDMSEEVAYAVVKAIWDQREDIAGRVRIAKWYGQTPGNMLAGLVPSIPVHPGAARFYKEMGVWDDRFTVGTVIKETDRKEVGKKEADK